jgi:hypothetical protein
MPRGSISGRGSVTNPVTSTRSTRLTCGDTRWWADGGTTDPTVGGVTVVSMADSAAVRTRRSRAHMAGDHRHCLVSNCPYAGQVERDEVHDLRSAIEIEFAGDRPRLQTARRLVELASGKGAPAVAALTQLDRMIEGARSGRYVPVTGPPTIDDEILALVEQPTAGRCECPCHAAGHDREVVG